MCTIFQECVRERTEQPDTGAEVLRRTSMYTHNHSARATKVPTSANTHLREDNEQTDTQVKVLWTTTETHNYKASGMVELNNANNERAAAE